MDEESLSASLETYRAQLEQVKLTLQASADPTQQADLVQLQNDLQHLIELTESSLLSLQKCNLLSILPAQDGHHSLSSQDREYEAFLMAVSEQNDGDVPPGGRAETEGSSDGSENEEDDDSSGMKVKAPYYSTWGTLEYHNAMVVGSEQTEDGDAGVRVLYLYPTHKAMKPCPYFLDGKCHFNETCRFSHGQVVPVSELQPFDDPDFDALGPDSLCLAKHSDGIWYPARITDISDGFYTVKFNSQLLKESVLEADSIIPPLRVDIVSSSSSDDDGDGLAVDSAFATVVSGGSTFTASSSVFGGWEAHTRGIGSKLMARMGYVFGKGLGRNAEGRVEPIQAVVLPKGKSLDQCIKMQQRRKVKRNKEHKSKIRRSKIQLHSGKTNRSVFDFLNEKLDGKKPSAERDETNVATQRKGKELYNASQDSKRALSVQVAITTEKIQQKQREIGRLKESLARHVGRDSVVSAQLELRLSSACMELTGLQKEESSLQRERKKADTHKKMTEF